MRNKMKKRTTGAGGSGITSDYWEYAQRIKVGPVRLPPDEIDAETFKEELERQGLPPLDSRKLDSKPLTTKEFIELYRQPGMQTKRRTRNRLQKIMDALQYFGNQEENWWIEQQMQILRVLDQNKYEYKTAAYNTWVRISFLPRVKKAHEELRKIDPFKAQEFLDYSYEIIKASKPKKRAAGSMIIIEKVRRMVLAGRYNELESFNRELAPILKP